MQSIERFKFDQIKNSAQFILLNDAGKLVGSCNSLFDTTNKSPEVQDWMPLLESIFNQILILELDSPELFLPKIQAPMRELRGFYDFSFSKIEWENEQLLLWVIYDNTKIYKDFFSYQQNRNELVLKNQRIGVIQSVLQSKRHELNSQIQRLNRFGAIKRNYYELISSNSSNNDQYENGNTYDSPNGETSSYISEVENTIGHLQDLVEELVILTNVKDISQFEKKEFQICSLLNQIVQNLADETTVSFDVNVHSDIPEQLIGNYIYLKQIIIGLIKESTKLKSTGMLTINLTPIELENTSNSFLVEYKYFGDEHVTDTDFNHSNGNRLDQNPLFNYGSELELKLSIIQKFVASHDGKFECESNEQGDLFVSFSFPYERMG